MQDVFDGPDLKEQLDELYGIKVWSEVSEEMKKKLIDGICNGLIVRE